jgi:hypothetical protein
MEGIKDPVCGMIAKEEFSYDYERKPYYLLSAQKRGIYETLLKEGSVRCGHCFNFSNHVFGCFM